MPENQWCSNCAYLNTGTNAKGGRNPARNGYVYPCDAPLPAPPPVPQWMQERVTQAMTLSHKWLRQVEPNYGTECAFWKSRKKKPKKQIPPRYVRYAKLFMAHARRELNND